MTDTDGEVTLGDIIPGTVDIEQLKAEIWQAVDALPDKQSEIIRKRYIEDLSLRKTGEQVRTMEFKGIKVLRRKLSYCLPDKMGSGSYSCNGVRTFNRTWTSSTERCALALLEK